MNEQLNIQTTATDRPGGIYKLIVIELMTERVWYEVTGAVSVADAVALYEAGEAIETGRKHLSTDQTEIEDVYQEDPNAVSMD